MSERGQRNFEHLTHTWVEKLVEKSWYITRKGIKRRGTEKKERERESKMLKKYNSKKEEFSIFDHITRACSKILFDWCMCNSFRLILFSNIFSLDSD